MSDITFESTNIATIENDQSSALHSQNGAETKVNLVQYSSCLDDFQNVQQKKQSAFDLPSNKKLLKLAVYSKCQVGINYLFQTLFLYYTCVISFLC